jgi:hypothetical protein
VGRKTRREEDVVSALWQRRAGFEPFRKCGNAKKMEASLILTRGRHSKVNAHRGPMKGNPWSGQHFDVGQHLSQSRCHAHGTAQNRRGKSSRESYILSAPSFSPHRSWVNRTPLSAHRAVTCSPYSGACHLVPERNCTSRSLFGRPNNSSGGPSSSILP